MDLLGDLFHDLGGHTQWPEVHVFGDATGQSRWAGTSESCWQMVAKGLASLGVWEKTRFRIRKANPPALDRINAVNDALRDLEGNSHVLIHPRCKILIRDFKRVRLDETGCREDQSDSKLSHASAALGYGIEYLRPVRMVSSVLDDDARFSVKV